MALSHEDIRANFLPESMQRNQQAAAMREQAENINRLQEKFPQRGGEEAALLRGMLSRLNAIEKNTHRQQASRERGSSTRAQVAQGQQSQERMREQSQRKREQHNTRLTEQREQYMNDARERVRNRASERARLQQRDQRGRFSASTTQDPRGRSRSAVKNMLSDGIRSMADRDPAVRLAVAAGKDAKRLYNHLRNQRKEKRERAPIRSKALRGHDPVFSGNSTMGPLGAAASLNNTSAFTGPGQGQGQGLGLGGALKKGLGKLGGLGRLGGAGAIGAGAAGAIGAAAGAAALPLAGGAAASYLLGDSESAGNSSAGAWINENIPGAAAVDDFVYRKTGGYVGTSMEDPRYSWNKEKAAAAGAKYSVDNPLNTEGDLSGAKPDQLQAATYDAFRRQGLSDQGARVMVAEINRENSFQSKYIFGSHTDAANAKRNSGMISWQGDRSDNMKAALEAGGHLDANGRIKRTQGAIDAQAGFLMKEMESGSINPRDKGQLHGKALADYLRSDKVDPNVGMDAVGTNYIKWAIDNPKYRDDGLKNRKHGYDSISQKLADHGEVKTTPIGGTTQADAGDTPGSKAGTEDMIAAPVEVPMTAEEAKQFWTDDRNPRGSRLYGKDGEPLVNPELLHSSAQGIKSFEAKYPQYRVESYGPSAGVRHSGSTANHGVQKDGHGGAQDFVIIDRATGKKLTNHPGREHQYQGTVGENAPIYQNMFNETVRAGSKLYPGFEKNARFGGYFKSSNPMDTMHADMRGKEVGMGYGSIRGGFSREAMRRYGIKENNPYNPDDPLLGMIPNPAIAAQKEAENAALKQQMVDARMRDATNNSLALPYADAGMDSAKKMLDANSSKAAFASLLGNERPTKDDKLITPSSSSMFDMPNDLSFPLAKADGSSMGMPSQTFSQPVGDTSAFSKDAAFQDSSRFIPRVKDEPVDKNGATMSQVDAAKEALRFKLQEQKSNYSTGTVEDLPGAEFRPTSKFSVEGSSRSSVNTNPDASLGDKNPFSMGQRSVDSVLGAPITRMTDAFSGLANNAMEAMRNPSGIAKAMGEFATGIGNTPERPETQLPGVSEPSFTPMDFSGINQQPNNSGNSTRVATNSGGDSDRLRITEINTMDEISMGMVNGMETV